MSDSNDKRKWEISEPHVYPGYTRRGWHNNAKSNYVVSSRHVEVKYEMAPIPPPPPKPPEPDYDYEAVVRVRNLASEVLGGGISRESWEQAILREYYRVYGCEWKEWARLIPWLENSAQISERAERLGLYGPWGWMQKSDFIISNKIDWGPSELDQLVRQYSNNQDNSRQQRTVIGNRSFRDIRSVALLLHLPTLRVISELAKIAKQLI